MKVKLWFLIAAAWITFGCAMTQKAIDPPSPTSSPPTAQLVSTSVPANSTPVATGTSAFTATPEFTCPNAPETQLEVGMTAQVTFTDGPALRLRRDPVVSNQNILKLLAEGTKVEIIAGPECVPVPDSAAAFVFWQVSVPGDVMKGWVAEGDAQVYYIEPVP